MALKGISEEERKELFPETTILLGYRGSIAHGTYVPSEDPDSIDDKDLMGVFIPSIKNYFGLSRFEHKEKMLREWDVVCYELRKYIRLLLKANPNVLGLLWLDEKHYVIKTELGQQLIDNRDMFASKQIYRSFTGYAHNQFRQMKPGEFRGFMGAKRKALVEKFGYDCKNATHLIRLLKMGIEFLNEGELHVHRHDASQLIDIKRGGWTLEQVKAEAKRLFIRAEAAYDNCKLPSKPDFEAVENLTLEILGKHFFDFGPIR